MTNEELTAEVKRLGTEIESANRRYKLLLDGYNDLYEKLEKLETEMLGHAADLEEQITEVRNDGGGDEWKNGGDKLG